MILQDSNSSTGFSQVPSTEFDPVAEQASITADTANIALNKQNDQAALDAKYQALSDTITARQTALTAAAQQFPAVATLLTPAQPDPAQSVTPS